MILARATLGSALAPFVALLLGNGKVINFKDGCWDDASPRIEIYDSAFVHQNVYAGDYVDHEHKKNLYRVIIGEAGTALAVKVDDFDSQIREANRNIAIKLAGVKPLIPGGMTLDTFLQLAQEPNIEQLVATAEAEVQALRRGNDIHSGSYLEILSVDHQKGCSFDNTENFVR